MDARSDDAYLVRRAQAGYLDAFEVLLQRHRDRVYRVALRMLGNPHDAEDAAQDALIQAWQALPRFRGDAAFSTWLYRIVTNVCLNRQRKDRPTATVAAVDPSRTAVPGPEQGVETAQHAAALTRAITSLPAEQRAALVLQQFEGLSYAEIAEVLGISESAVKSRLWRARQALVQQLREWS